MGETTYYSIYIPSQAENSDGYVFTEKEEALKILKGYKDGRLKSFKNRDDAIKYSQTGHEVVIQKFPDLKSPSAAAEKATFYAPTKQERINFRKAIEDGDYNKVNEIIWKNPRYLVNVGDTPTSLKDGYRYNALHICAIHKKADIADLILQTISTISFVELLHGKKNSKVCQEVCEILLDYYLNMPEKGRSETPLHLAVKYGAIEVVEVLTTYSQCKMIPNLENLLPKDIICDRINDAPNELKEKIANLLEERFYVPVIRSIDGTVPPSVGQPFSQTNLPDLNMDPLSPELEIQAYAGPMSKEQARNFRRRWKTPPRSCNRSPSRTLNVCLSPHKSKLLASTPRKTVNQSLNLNPTVRSLFTNESDDIMCEDTQNGNFVNEKNNKLSSQEIKYSSDRENNNGVHLNEDIQKLNETVTDVTPKQLNSVLQFNKLNLFALTPLLKKNPAKKDLFFKYREKADDSPIVLFDKFNDSNQFNNSDCILSNTTMPDSILALKEMHVKLTDTEKGLEMIGRELAKEQNIEWKEYWDFLGIFVDIASPEGLDKLEQHLKLRKKKTDEENATDAVKINAEKMARNEKELMHLCDELHKFGLIKDKNNINSAKPKNNLINSNTIGISRITNEQNAIVINGLNENKSTNSNQQTATPYLCVEKSLQVFAKRCTKTILHNIKNVVSIHDSFLSELKRLKSLICSFKDDTRFLEVDFTYVHSRFANLIVSYLKNSQDTDNNILFEIRQCFEQIIQSRMKVIDKHFMNSISVSDKKEQLQCVAEFLLKFLKTEEPKILPENLKTEKICAETWANEYHCQCQWETVLSRQASRKKRHDSHTDVSKKLFSELNTNDHSGENKALSNLNSINTETWRKSQNDSFNSSYSSENNFNDSDDDVFYSDFGSDEDNDYNFYTPPDSPTMLELDVSDIHDYNVYLLGNEPTKRDLDVLNAIFHIDIDKDKYPNIYHWRTAILKHPNDERDNFPSPSVVVKKHNSFRESRRNNFISGRRLFAPSKFAASSPIKNHLTKFVSENLVRQNNLSSGSSNSSNNSLDLNISNNCVDISPSITPTTIIEQHLAEDLSLMNVSKC